MTKIRGLLTVLVLLMLLLPFGGASAVVQFFPADHPITGADSVDAILGDGSVGIYGPLAEGDTATVITVDKTYCIYVLIDDSACGSTSGESPCPAVIKPETVGDCTNCCWERVFEGFVEPSTATTDVEGLVELATNAETGTGTATDLAVTPDDLTFKLAAPGTIGGTTPGVVNGSSFVSPPSATPEWTFQDSDDANGTADITCESSGGDNPIVWTVAVEEDDGATHDYIQADGVNERINLLEPVAVTGTLSVSGAITGLGLWGANITGNISLNTTALHGMMYQVTAAGTITLDKVTDVGFGASVYFWVRDASETVIIEVDDADKINLHGTPLDAGDTIDSPGNAGDFIVLISTTDADGSGTDGWITGGYGEAVWTDGDAS